MAFRENILVLKQVDLLKISAKKYKPLLQRRSVQLENRKFTN